jgi:hypothetical protein
MTINYTTNLSLAEPVTGTESGTWGDDVNKGLTDYLDIAIAGTLALTSASFTSNALTLANTTGNNSSNGITTTTAQYYVLKVSSLAANVTITAPSSSKSYVVVNLDSTYSVTVKASGQTGITVPAGQRALVVYNGTDYVQVGASAGGSNTQVQYNSSGALAGSSNFTFNGTTATINTLNLTNALGVGYGGTGITTTPVNGALLIGNGSGYSSATLTAGSNITITNSSGGITIAAAGTGSTYTRTSFTATASQTTFSVTYTVGYVEVYLNGVLLNGTDYTATSGTSIVLAVGANSGDIVETIAYSVTSLGTASSSTNIAGGAAGEVVYQSGSGATSFTAAGTTGQVLISGGTSAPTWSSTTGSGNVVLATSPTLVTPLLGTPTSGTLSNCTVDGTNGVGYINIPVNAQSAAYTAVASDAGKIIFHPSTDANARTFTIPANSSVAYPVGTTLSFINMTSQAVTIAITTDTMYLSSAGTTGSRTLAQYGSATAVKMTSTTWLISGSGLT